ncbi:UNVERIFIED_CONTAM: glycosyltransferase family 2 protein, partial [Salmonella enterica subsp. enterica serovar Weltevreden]
ALIRELGGLRLGFEGAQDYDLALRVVDAVDRAAVLHIPKVLYHWRTAVGSTASGHGNKSYAFEAGRRALVEHLQRRRLHGDVVEAAEAP